MVVILHSGQTGVERGAHHGALAAGLSIAGVMRAERRDELGLVPAEIAERLGVCNERGSRAALFATLELATALLIIVPDIAVALRRRTAAWLLRRARARSVPFRLCDATTGMLEITEWYGSIAPGDHRILVTGPRATRWNAGEGVARRLVKSFLLG